MALKTSNWEKERDENKRWSNVLLACEPSLVVHEIEKQWFQNIHGRNLYAQLN